jgi:small-conductance mechanosensitive channel
MAIPYLKFIIPLAFIIVSIIAGLIVEKIVFTRLKKITENKIIPWLDIIVQSLHRIPFIWFVITGFYAAILSYEFKPDITHLFKEIIVSIFILSLTIFTARLASGFVSLLSQKTEGISASLFSNITKVTVLVIGILLILPNLGIEITPILTTLGVGGLAVGLALQETLSNLFSGLVLIFSKQLRTGDYIKIEDGLEGYVTDITWRYMTIKELANNTIIIPNSKVAASSFTNYHLPVKDITLTINVGVHYDSNLEHVEKVTIDVAKEVMSEIASDLQNSHPHIIYHKFGENGIYFLVYIPLKEFYDQRIATHLFIKKLHRRFQEEDIQMPTPYNEVFLKSSIR